jgi:hypothetical protein
MSCRGGTMCRLSAWAHTWCAPTGPFLAPGVALSVAKNYRYLNQVIFVILSAAKNLAFLRFSGYFSPSE